MKKQHILFPFVLASIAMLAVSCQKEKGTVTLGAEIQKAVNSSTKVYIDDHTPCWHNGDVVYINNAAYPIMAASGASARIEDVVSSSTYRAIFPASIVPAGSNINSSGSVPVTLPSVQHYELVNGHQRVDVPMGAYISGGSTLQFYNLCSVVRVTVSNSLNQELTLRRIELTAAASGLSGAGNATVSGSVNDLITMSSTASHSVTLSFGDNSTRTVGALATETFDIVVPQFGTDDVTITIHTTDGMYSEVEKENVALAHNTITTVTANVTALAEAPHAELVDGPTFKSAIPSNATSVVFEYNSNVSSGTLLSTASSPAPIYGNLVGSEWKVSTNDNRINANPNCYQMFSYKSRLASIIFGAGFNTSNVTNMSSMFNNCDGLTGLDLSYFNTSNVTNMSSMFNHCDGLTGLDLSYFNTSNVTNMSGMFQACSNLTSLNISSFNTSNVTNMSYMFAFCYNLTNLNVSNFVTTNVINMNYMFYDCLRLTSLDVTNFNTSNVTQMQAMFMTCEGLTSLDVSNFNTSNVRNMSGMFNSCSGLTSLDVSNFNTRYVTDMSAMFYGCSGLTSLNLSNFNTSNVTTMYYMFYGCSALSSLNVSNFSTSRVTDMSYMFYGCSSLTSHNLSSFNTSSVTNMACMFMDCSGLAYLGLSSFNTSNVQYMDDMFRNCSGLTNLNLSNFNMSNVTSKSYMCLNLSTSSGYCYITCPYSVETAMRSGTSLPTSGVTFTWLRP